MPKAKSPESGKPFEKPEERFINRELSWLEFNTRVLEEADNVANPLLERVKFLSISANNLNEFYMLRVAGLKDQMRHTVPHPSMDGLTPEEQLIKIRDKAERLMSHQQKSWGRLKQELHQASISILNRKDLNKEDKAWLEKYFLNNIFPALSPIAIDPAHPLPFLPNLGLAAVFQLQRKKDKGQQPLAVMLLPHNLGRFIRLDGRAERFILFEEVVELFKGKLFPEEKITGFGLIHLARDSDLEIDEEAEDLVSNFESAVKRRKRGSVIHLMGSASLPKEIRKFLMEEYSLTKEDVFEVEDMLALEHVMELYACARPDLKFEPHKERFPERINDYGGDCFAAIAAKDIVIHHPYETFDVVVNFLRQAARDPHVVAIKQTLYRTSNDSPIVQALIEAAEAGKAVTVVVELKARFDEEANIRWAKNLERAGAQVVFGFVELKTHAKVSLVVRREGKNLKSYVHFGTGNYHPVTARAYSDLSFFTCQPEFCQDASYVFNYLTGYSPPEAFNKISISPLTLRKQLMSLIEAEIEYAKAGKPAAIWAKMNALIDPDIIDALYRASQAGVKIDLIIRGICGLRPGIEGFSDNIRVKSLIGRFLEHARICCFGGGHKLPSKQAKVFLSSADWMPRNFDRRVEILLPIENATVHEQVMGQIMLANLKDEKQSWWMNSDGSYARQAFTSTSFSAHEYFITNPSLSGRGKALTEAQSEEQRRKIYQLFEFNKQKE